MPERSPSPPKVVTDSDRIGAEEDIDEFRGLSEEEVRGRMALRESRANAQLLEMIGDIPDADARPPENVLFVCKLNPVTSSEDLEIIFSRFGPIQSCEVICDQKTGDSLQYAFIDFEREDDCVSAYFKMDNVLIDDRRIHVDFSQSLAKVKGLRRLAHSESEDKPRGDGLIAKATEKKDGYDLVFDDSSEGGGGGGGAATSERKGKKRRWDMEGGSSLEEPSRPPRDRARERDEGRREREGRERERGSHGEDRERGREGRGENRRERDRREEDRREGDRESRRERDRDSRREEDMRGRERDGGRERRRREELERRGGEGRGREKRERPRSRSRSRERHRRDSPHRKHSRHH